MSNFEITFRYHTRPRGKKGRSDLVAKTFAAPDLVGALRLAREFGREQFAHKRWQLIKCEEVRVPKTTKEKS